MNNKKEYRRLKFLMHKISHIIAPSYIVLRKIEKPQVKKRLKEIISIYDENDKPTPIKNGAYRKSVNEVKEFNKLLYKLNVSEEELLDLWIKDRLIRKSGVKYNTINGIKEKKDNKNVKVGSGGSNKNKIRYPKLKRSKATWKRFYKLFPHAERRKEI